MRPIVPLAVVALLLLAGVSDAGEAAKQNVVIVLADDLGYGDLGCYGHPLIRTPNLDRFAAQGMRFTQGYSASAVCSPSRSAILTGRTPYRNGVFNWIPEGSEIHLRSSEITVTTLLRRLGYATCHVGKWHLNGFFNSPQQPQPSDHGYDWWFATQNNAGPSHKNPSNFVRNGKAAGALEGFSSQLIVDEAIRWLDTERDKAKPFFLAVWFHEPHLPIETDPRFQALYPDFLQSDADRAQHHGNVTQMDDAFGRLMRRLQELGLNENTIVVFTSDNGPEGPTGLTARTRGSTGGLRGRKRSVYEGGIRVPFLVRWPGRVPAGATSDQPVVGSDIFTTICTITKAPLPQDRPIDGVSMLPAFQGKDIERSRPMYWRCPIAPEELKICMRQGSHTLLANPALTRFELYDLATDPKQASDLATKEPARFEAMKQALVRLNEEIEKEGPAWWRGKEIAPKKQPAKKRALP
jgi:arylsulfatase A